MFMEKYLQKTVTTTPWVRATWTWAAGCMIPEQPGTQLLIPSAGQDHWSFKRAWWITACAECLFCLKTYLKYPAEHAECYQAAPACKEFNAGRPLSRFFLGSTSSQKEKHQPLPCQDHSLRYLPVASVSGILNCHCSLSAHTHALSDLAGASWRASPSLPRKTILLTAKWHSRCYCYTGMHKIHTLLPSSSP